MRPAGLEGVAQWHKRGHARSPGGSARRTASSRAPQGAFSPMHASSPSSRPWLRQNIRRAAGDAAFLELPIAALRTASTAAPHSAALPKASCSRWSTACSAWPSISSASELVVAGGRSRRAVHLAGRQRASCLAGWWRSAGPASPCADLQSSGAPQTVASKAPPRSPPAACTSERFCKQMAGAVLCTTHRGAVPAFSKVGARRATASVQPSFC